MFFARPNDLRPTSPARRFVAGAACVALVSSGCAVITVSLSAAPASAAAAVKFTAVRNVSDKFARTVSHGLGRATVGGAYTVAPSKYFSVRGHRAHIGPIAQGHTARAVLKGVRVGEERIAATYVLGSLPTSGSGEYFGIELRRQTNGNVYRVWLRVRPHGIAYLAISKVINGKQRKLGNSPRFKVAAHKAYTVIAQITGATPVHLAAAVYPTASPSRRTSVSRTDAAKNRITHIGTYGLWLYNLSKPSARLDVAALAGSHLVRPAKPKPPQGPGSLAPGRAAYPVPRGAVVVSPTGKDTAAGTLSAPLRTVRRAVAIAKSGSTIVLRGGGYHEQLTIPANKTLTIQPYPREVVWFDGSSIVSSWQKLGTAWVHTGWTAQFDSTPGYANYKSSQQTWVNSQHPMAAHPDQVFFDGQQLTQVASLTKVVAHTFYVDYKTHRLYVGSNPGGHLVRASDLATALTVQSPNTVLRGFGVRRYATSVPLLGTVSLVADHDQIANVVITDNASQGLHLRGPRIRVDHVTATYNGLMGIHGNYVDGVQIFNSLVEHNNSEHFNFAPVSSGMKITRSRGIVVGDSVFNSNDGNGLWLDESCYNIVLTGNKTQNNTRSGISFELSAVATIANNTTTGNTYDGMRITDTSSVKIWNNTITNNMSRQIEIVQDSRKNTPSAAGHDPRQPNPDPTVPWVSRNVQIENNIFVAGGQYHVYVADSTGARTAAQMNVTVDGDMFSSPAIQGYAPFGWGTADKKVTRYYTPAQFTAATKGGRHNMMSSGRTVQTIKPHIDNRNAMPLPKDIAAKLHKATGTKHAGAF